MRFIFYFLPLLLASCQTNSTEEIEKKTSYYLNIARGYLSQCLYPQALLETRRALKLQPDSYILNDAIGVIYRIMNQSDTAQAHFLKAIRITPAYTQSKVNLAQVLMVKKKWDLALAYLKEAIQDLTYKDPSRVYSLIGKIYVAQKQNFKAKKYLDSALQINAQNCLALLEYGKMYFNQKKDKFSIYQFKKVKKCINKIKIMSSCGVKILDHYYYQAMSEVRVGKIDAARKNLKIYLLKGNNRSPYYSLSIKLLKKIQKK